MASVGQKNTAPEIAVRKVLHSLGFRFRLHRRDLPGSPDIVLPRLKLAVFVHGCFWHRHRNCKYTTMPKTRPEFWRQKFLRNVQRDEQAIAALKRLGWRSLTVWGCEVRDVGALAKRLRSALKNL